MNANCGVTRSAILFTPVAKCRVHSTPSYLMTLRKFVYESGAIEMSNSAGQRVPQWPIVCL